ncbi:MAG TPA: DinB family protein [Candidatus Limnocylindrales bacterium]|nr:DinB family protein [Candidatus Limnocylindrales bacterium]
MNGSLLVDAFDHHVWATITILDVCAGLTEEQLQAPVPGTFGPIRDTLEHLVDADRSYLRVLMGEDPEMDVPATSIDGMRAVMVANGPLWRQLLAGELDPARDITRSRPDGSTSTAPLTIRLAQVIHHGTDHRSQVCTGLTSLGIEPPEIDVWDFAWKDGRLSETEPTGGAADAG